MEYLFDLIAYESVRYSSSVFPSDTMTPIMLDVDDILSLPIIEDENQKVEITRHRQSIATLNVCHNNMDIFSISRLGMRS